MTDAPRTSVVEASDGVSLHVAEWNPAGTRTVVLLHGFPDDHTVWDDLRLALPADLHVVAYDSRGSGRSDRPRRAASYRVGQLADDLERVIAAVAPDRLVHLVAHDWGTAAAWEAVSRREADWRFASYTCVSGFSVDHVRPWVRASRASGREGRRAVRSMWKSPFYMGFFALPGIGYAAARGGMVDATLRPLMAAERGPVRVRPSGRARANAASVRLYRANLPQVRRPDARITEVPVQVIAPRHDLFITPPTAEMGRPWARTFTTHSTEGGHWSIASHPQAVADLVSGFISATDPQNSREDHAR